MIKGDTIVFIIATNSSSSSFLYDQNSKKLDNQGFDHIQLKIDLLFAKIRESESIGRKQQFNSTNVSEEIYMIAYLSPQLTKSLSLRDIVNIISRNSPETENEHLIINLNEALHFFLKRPKMIYQNSMEMLYRILVGNNLKEEHIFRQNNEPKIFSGDHLLVSDFNHIKPHLEELINFIQSADSRFIDMQNVFLKTLKIAPFTQHNKLYSKLLSIWFHESKKSFGSEKFDLEFYLQTLNIHWKTLEKAASNAIKYNDSSYFLLPLTEKLLSCINDHIIVKHIKEELKTKKNIYFSSNQARFLFLIIQYKFNSDFMWRDLQKIIAWPVSKQFVSKTLSELEKFDLIKSKIVKNRKFYKPSRMLVMFINRFSVSKKLINNNKIKHD